jgi:hypothetical protein
MKLSAYSAICLAVVTVGLVILWGVREDSVPTEGAEGAPGVRLSDQTESITVEPDESVGPESRQMEQTSSEEAADSALAKRQKDMEDGIYQLVGPSVIQSLTQSGLALADSEAIARGLAADTAKCTMDSLRVEAERQSVPVDELLSHLQAAVRTGGELLAAADLSSLQANAFSCQADAMQRAGIVYPSGLQVSEEQTKKLMECVRASNTSDVVDRGATLEICSSEVFGEVP